MNFGEIERGNMQIKRWKGVIANKLTIFYFSLQNSPSLAVQAFAIFRLRNGLISFHVSCYKQYPYDIIVAIIIATILPHFRKKNKKFTP